MSIQSTVFIGNVRKFRIKLQQNSFPLEKLAVFSRTPFKSEVCEQGYSGKRGSNLRILNAEITQIIMPMLSSGVLSPTNLTQAHHPLVIDKNKKAPYQVDEFLHLSNRKHANP